MQTRLVRTAGRTAVALAVAASAALVPAGIASAAPAAKPGPSACNAGHQHGTITPRPSTADVANYTVTVYADPGTSTCQVGGSPSHLRFSENGTQVPAEVSPTGVQNRITFLGDGMPVQFDVHVPQSGDTKPADTITFTPRNSFNDLPVTFTASGPIQAGPGVTVGPMVTATH
ncbi:hypothetical protein [Pseudonocardia phyllosphaerae]|uniref:hypothetical protein n=1 Tax=Pseudonocardia phyllosphaerae TaxID=3390502 RepID=UPI00397C6C2A